MQFLCSVLITNFCITHCGTFLSFILSHRFILVAAKKVVLDFIERTKKWFIWYVLLLTAYSNVHTFSADSLHLLRGLSKLYNFVPTLHLSLTPQRFEINISITAIVRTRFASCSKLLNLHTLSFKRVNYLPQTFLLVGAEQKQSSCWTSRCDARGPFYFLGLITLRTKVKDKGMHNERRAFVRAQELPQVYYLQIKFKLFRDYWSDRSLKMSSRKQCSTAVSFELFNNCNDR